MTIRLDGRTALITGAARGVGLAHARVLAARGASVVVNDIDGEEARVAANTIVVSGGTAISNAHSVATADGAKAIVAQALEAFGRLDIVIANAGFLHDRSFAKMTIQEVDDIVRVHLLGSLYTTHAAWPAMQAQQFGRIVLTTSSSGLYGTFGQANYAAAKLGVVGLLNALKQEGPRYGIEINAIAPVAASRLSVGVFPDTLVEKMKSEWIAGVAAYLCAPECMQSGMILEIGAGHVCSVQVMENEGVTLPEDAIGNPDAISAALPAILSGNKWRTYPNGASAVRKVLGVT